MSYVPDSLDMFNIHEAERESYLAKLPKCAECGDAIQDDFCYEIDGGVLMCERCIEACRKYTEDFTEE